MIWSVYTIEHEGRICGVGGLGTHLTSLGLKLQFRVKLVTVFAWLTCVYVSQITTAWFFFLIGGLGPPTPGLLLKRAYTNRYTSIYININSYYSSNCGDTCHTKHDMLLYQTRSCRTSNNCFLSTTTYKNLFVVKLIGNSKTYFHSFSV